MRDITRPEVWAPAASTVELVLEGERRPLTRTDDGWWRGTPLEPGTRYAFSIDDGNPLPDPRSLSQPEGPHAASEIVDPAIFDRPAWAGTNLRGKVFYELHIGTFTDEGTFDAAIDKLDHLVELGVDAIEIMPVADFPGERGWGYDGVGLYATHHAYGGPSAFVRFVDAAHERGLGVILDVVHNHLGPEGNYLAEFGPYFTDEHDTPWGAAVNLDADGSEEIRAFLLGAVRQWIVDFQLDGLRLDAVHALHDRSELHFLAEISNATDQWAEELDRPIFIAAESDLNQPYMVAPTESMPKARGMDAQWADDVHHALHSFFSQETDGYYVDFGSVEVVQKALMKVFVHDGNHSTFREQEWGAPVDPLRGLYDGHSFVVFIQNHDQVGNRAIGDRLGHSVEIGSVAAAAATYLLSPYTPMLFMGEEWDASSRFPFFSHLGKELGPFVTEGREAEFAKMGWANTVPDPQAESTFLSAKLRWPELDLPVHRRVFDWYKTIIRLRRELPGAMDPDLLSTTVDIIDGDSYVMRRPGFSVYATRAAQNMTIVTEGGVLASWDEPIRSGKTLTFHGPGVVVVSGE